MNGWVLLTFIVSFVALVAILYKTGYIETEEQAKHRREREAAERQATSEPPTAKQETDPVTKQIIAAIVGAAICSGIVKLAFRYFG